MNHLRLFKMATAKNVREVFLKQNKINQGDLDGFMDGMRVCFEYEK